MIHSEVSEALEGLRKSIPLDGNGGMVEELADIIIRTMDLAEHFNIDIEEAIILKHKLNLKRKYKHGKKF